MDLKSIDLKNVPSSPGVYKFLDKDNKIIYVGKAHSIKKRVAQYFREDIDNIKTQTIINNAARIEWTPTDTEYKALLLENEIIKKYQPKFNIRLRDDKTYPYLKITKDKFPSLQITRKLKDDGGIYFGPYTSALYLKNTLKTLRSIFPMRGCRLNLKNVRQKRPCLDYSLGLCSGPCSCKIKKDEYRKLVKKVMSFLEGDYKKVLLYLEREMKKASKLLEFEKAGVLRDKIFAVERIIKEDAGRFERLAHKEFLIRKEINYKKVSNNLKKYLELKDAPCVIEGIDVSNISGKYSTGSVVVFENGVPNKNEYRRYRIKNVSGQDDYGMIKEVVKRRYSRLYREGKRMPDLVIIDGGRGHLNTAYSAIDELNLSFDIISIAKERGGIYLKDRPYPVYLPDDSEELHLLQNIRNEAHRFARRYHLTLRWKNSFL